VPAMITTRYFLEQPGNIALGSFISRMFWRLSDYGLISSHESARVAASFAARGALVIGAAALTWTRRSSGEPDIDRRAYSLWLVTMIMISPTAWNHYLILLLLPFIQITSAAVAGRVGRPTVMMCVASYILIEISIVIFALSGFVNSHPSLSIEMGFISAAAAWIAVALFAGRGVAVTVAHPQVTAAANQSTAVA